MTCSKVFQPTFSATSFIHSHTTQLTISFSFFTHLSLSLHFLSLGSLFVSQIGNRSCNPFHLLPGGYLLGFCLFGGTPIPFLSFAPQIRSILILLLVFQCFPLLQRRQLCIGRCFLLLLNSFCEPLLSDSRVSVSGFGAKLLLEDVVIGC